MSQAQLPQAEAIHLAVIGLGYVGLPLAVGFGRKLPTLGFDVNQARIEELKQHRDHTLETTPDELRSAMHLKVSHDANDLKACNVFIVTVPTPIGRAKRPDLTPLKSASVTVGRAISRGSIVIFESATLMRFCSISRTTRSATCRPMLSLMRRPARITSGW